VLHSDIRSTRMPGSSLRNASFFRWVTVVLVIAVSLALVGTQQYQWSMEVKRAAEFRVGTDIEATMMKWHLDFYSEMSAICTALQIGPDSGARDTWDDYSHRYGEWFRAGQASDSAGNIYATRDLVNEVYIWQAGIKARPSLLRLDPVNEKIEGARISPALLPLLIHLQKNASSLDVALRAWESEDASGQHRSSERGQLLSRMFRGDAVAGWQFDEGVPAIVHPLVRHTSSQSISTKGKRKDEPVDWVIAVLNLSTIQKQILPKLTRRYFGDGEDVAYKVAVLRGGSDPNLLYSTDTDSAARDVHASDAVMNIFGSYQDFGEPWWLTDGDRESTNPDFTKPEEPLRFSSPVWFHVIRHTSNNGPWLLVLRARKGALDTAVTRVWRSHLLISGIVLLLLAASVVLVIVISRRAEALAHLQMEFVTSVSHELRTPLAAILSAGQNLKDGFAADPKLYGWLITTQVRQEIELVDQILAFAATKNAATHYDLQSLEVSELLDSMLRDTVTIFEQSGFVVDVQIAPGLPQIVGEPQLICRCLQNLIANAAKYSGRSRWIGISAELEEPENPARGVRISVADRGMGISSSDIHRIFEPFYRSPRAVAAHIHGTGLGLSVTKRLAESMKASVSVQSEPGIGSVFTMHFQTVAELTSQMVA